VSFEVLAALSARIQVSGMYNCVVGFVALEVSKNTMPLSSRLKRPSFKIMVFGDVTSFSVPNSSGIYAFYDFFTYTVRWQSPSSKHHCLSNRLNAATSLITLVLKAPQLSIESSNTFK
jgi:hypothetical protein